MIARVLALTTRSTRTARASLIVLACLSALNAQGGQGRPAVPAPAPLGSGILLLAHGGSPAWNERISALAARVNQQTPVEVAFGMASRPAIQSAIDRLVARGVTDIVAVPLFVSSHSSVVASTAYILGLRRDMPAALRAFATSHGGDGGHASHSGGRLPASAADAPDPTSPVVSPVPIRMTGALDRHPVVAEILVTRARAIAPSHANHAVILVAHGPESDEDNRLWLDDMQAIAARVKTSLACASVDVVTVRDDAPAPIRDAATVELRALVASRIDVGHRVLVVPLLLSFGGVEQGIRKRLDGLEYTMSSQGLAPDDRLADWVLAAARETGGRAHPHP